MAGADDRLVSEGSQLELISNEKAARSVLISNISPKLRREDIIIYFQKRKFGGGEVDEVSIIKDGKAVIVFEKAEVAERVMKSRHVLGGDELELKPYRPGQEKTPRFFSSVTARVNVGIFQLSVRESQNLLEKVKNEAGITWREDADAFILTGMFDQIQNAHRYLEEYFGRRPYLTQEGEAYSKDTGNTKQNSGGFSRQASKAAKITDICEVDVQPTFMKLLKQVYKTTLQDMEEEFRLEIFWVEDEQKVTIRPKENTQESLYHEGCDAFISLYQKVHQDFKREVVEVENVNDEEGIQNAIRLVEAENPVVIENLNNQLFVYADEKDMKSSVKALKKQLELIQTSNQTAARGQRSFSHDACNMTEQHQRDQPPSPNILQHTLSNGVNLSLLQGDITEEKVDAIVNPTNSQLRHGKAGVAAAIVRKGGRQILDDCWFVMSQRNAPLQVGEAVYTLSGNLPCQNVIHTVGPDWSVNGREASVPLLRRACLESLRLAARLRLCSIALPAISSGSFGMPKDVCAQAIFKAVEEYSSSIDAECSNLRDIRIVIIDDPTIEVFRGEFVKRYCLNDSHSPIDQERASASATNSTGHPQSAKGTLDNQGKNVGNKSPKAEVDNSKRDDEIEQMGKQNIKSSNLHATGREQSVRLPNENGAKTDETTLACSVKEPLNESGELNIRKEENAVFDQRSGKTSKSSGVKATVGRGTFAPTFPPKGNGHPTKSITAGRGMTSKQIKPSPGVAVAVANGGPNPHEHPMEPVSHDQRTDAANLVTRKEETKAKRVSATNANQPVAGRNGADKDTLKVKYLTETGDEEISSVNSPLNGYQAGGITHPDKIKKADTRDDDDNDSGDSNGGNVPDSEANASKARKTETQTSRSYTPTEGSTADKDTAENFTQVPPEKTTNQTDPDSPTTEPSTTKDPLEFGDTSQSSDQSVHSHCSICQSAFRDPVYSSKCGHTFCKRCVDEAVANGTSLVMCNEEWCACQRNQPVGLMSWRTEKQPLPGYEDCETIAITYNFHKGQQGWEHPRPGHPYEKLYFTAYLPNNAEGQAVCEMLERAFDARLLFTIGKSRSTGEDNQILWNFVEHKTNRLGGPSNYGYPDPDYLGRVRLQLASRGIKDDTSPAQTKD